MSPRIPGLLAVLGCVALPATASAQARPVRTTPDITVADLRQRLFLITDDSTEGRDTGSRGDYVVTEYVAAEFKRLGLRPGGDGGSWFQNIPFYQAAPKSRTLTIAGGGTLTFGVDYVIPFNSAPVISAPPFNSVATIYGGVASDDSASWITAEQAAGKLVVLDIRGGRDVVSPNRLGLQGRFSQAAAVAVVQLDLYPPAGRFALTRARARLDSTAASARVFPFYLTARAAEQLFGAPTDRLLYGALGKSISGDISLHYTPVQYQVRNVIGILPGRDPALRGQYVSTSGHHDHVGICGAPVDHDSMRAFLRVYRPMGADTRQWTVNPEGDAKARTILDSLRKVNRARPDSICNGADDDGSGTVALLELAEYFASLPMAQRPRRSLLFVSHAAEEVGLLGSAWFTDHPTVPVDSIVAEIDEDMIGRGFQTDLPEAGPKYLEVVGARRLSNEFGDILEASNRAQPLPFEFNYAFDAPGHPLQYYCRADHYSYARYGIPSVAFSRGEHLDYHQVTDEARYIDYEDYARVVRMVREALTRIGNLDHAPKLDKPRGDPRARCVQ